MNLRLNYYILKQKTHISNKLSYFTAFSIINRLAKTISKHCKAKHTPLPTTISYTDNRIERCTPNWRTESFQVHSLLPLLVVIFIYCTVTNSTTDRTNQNIDTTLHRKKICCSRFIK